MRLSAVRWFRVYVWLSYLIDAFGWVYLRIRAKGGWIERQEAQERLALYYGANSAASNDASNVGSLIPSTNISLQPMQNVQPVRMWIHATSAGEALLVCHVKAWMETWTDQTRDINWIVTVSNYAAYEMVRSRMRGKYDLAYAPLDTPLVFGRFLRRWRPKGLMLMEGEFWPGWMAWASDQEAGCIVLSARLTKRSYARWLKLSFIARSLFNSVRRIIASGPVNASRFAKIMAETIPSSSGPSELVPLDAISKSWAHSPDSPTAQPRLRVTHNLKFDLRSPKGSKGRTMQARSVWMAASLQSGEFLQLLSAHQMVRARVPHALMILAPRHPRECDRILAMGRSMGLRCARRSELTQYLKSSFPSPMGAEHNAMRDGTHDLSHAIDAWIDNTDVDVVIIDRLGELDAWYRCSDACFIGGSLVPLGGHNPLEAARWGAHVVTGPHTHLFNEMYDAIESISLPTSLSTRVNAALAPFDGDATKGICTRAHTPDAIAQCVIACIHPDASVRRCNAVTRRLLVHVMLRKVRHDIRQTYEPVLREWLNLATA